MGGWVSNSFKGHTHKTLLRSVKISKRSWKCHTHLFSSYLGHKREKVEKLSWESFHTDKLTEMDMGEGRKFSLDLFQRTLDPATRMRSPTATTLDFPEKVRPKISGTAVK